MLPWLNLLELLKTTIAPKLCTTVVFAVLLGTELLINLCFSYSYLIIFVFTRVHVLFWLNYWGRWCFHKVHAWALFLKHSAEFTTLISHHFLSNLMYFKHALWARPSQKALFFRFQLHFRTLQLCQFNKGQSNGISFKHWYDSPVRHYKDFQITAISLKFPHQHTVSAGFVNQMQRSREQSSPRESSTSLSTTKAAADLWLT